MKRIKAFFYNIQWNYILAILIFFLLVLLFEEERRLSVLIVAFSILLYFLVNVVVNQRKNKKMYYLQYGYILFYKKALWINQQVKKKRDMNKCPKKEFVKELVVMLKEIPEGTTCYCCTHELIKKHILKKYPDVELTEAYKKDLKKLKRKLKTKRCEQCTSTKCTLFQREKTQFYSIKFVKSNINQQ